MFDRLAAALVALLASACSAPRPVEPPASTVTLVVNDGAHRTALGPLVRVERGGYCGEGDLYRAASKHAALSVCVPHDPAAPVYGHVSYYGLDGRDRFIATWHHAPLDASHLQVIEGPGGARFARLRGRLELAQVTEPASFTGVHGHRRVHVALVGEVALLDPQAG